MSPKRIFTFSNLTLFTALALSTIAAWYSILGLIAIFAAAVVPIIIMGGALEIAKVVTTVWLHRYWDRVALKMKLYLVPAVVALAFLTSMGIFGFLSKAHLDQAVPTGDVAAKVALLDEKIKTERDNIETARAALKQMDSQVDQVLGRTTDDKGAERAVTIRRQQATERARLQKEIATAQAAIAKLNEERAPIASELRKVEAEVGPIKYIAALIYGDNPDANLLERAVRWVIILIVLVFDPLALTLVLAANTSKKWEDEEPKNYEKDDGPLTKEQYEQLKETAPEVIESSEVQTNEVETEKAYLKKPWVWNVSEHKNNNQPVVEEIVEPEPVDTGYKHGAWPFPIEDTPGECAECGTELITVPGVGPVCPNKDCDTHSNSEVYAGIQPKVEPKIEATAPAVTEEIVTEGVTKENPIKELEGGYILYDGKMINKDALMSLHPEIFRLTADSTGQVSTNFGIQFPKIANKGDVFVRVDILPNRVYKFEGNKWIEINKDLTDSYLYDEEYIKYLVSKIEMGEYDPELLSDNERAQIEDYLRNQNT